MSFFKDFKEDFSQAMNELMPGGDTKEKEDELVVNTLEQELDAKAELDKLEGLFEKVEEPITETHSTFEQDSGAAAFAKTAESLNKAEAQLKAAREAAQGVVEAQESEIPKPQAKVQMTAASQTVRTRTQETADSGVRAQAKEHTAPATKAQPQEIAAPATEGSAGVESVPKETVQPEIRRDTGLKSNPEQIKETKEDSIMDTNAAMNTLEENVNVQPKTPKEVSDEITVITEGTTLTGNMESIGSIEVRGQVNGNVECNGKLTVTGTIKGNSTSSEFFADSAKVEGEINTDGTVKIGLGSVVIGNITATSAVIAGAIKGDIDVQGPVVVDTSAVVMGNIKSRSVQINNGAVIEGFCSQCYAEVDVNKLFD